MSLQKCIKKIISKRELDEVIQGKIKEPSFVKFKYISDCYDCKGFNKTCPLYDSDNLLFIYDSILKKRK